MLAAAAVVLVLGNGHQNGAKEIYDRDGFVTIRQVFNATQVAQLQKWAGEVGSWPESKDKWLHHFEATEEGPRLARTEGFVSYHPELGRMLMAGTIPEIVGMAMGEPVFLFKEKINYKYPGGAGYAAHQDAPAYKQVSLHATALVAIERSTVDNGCLEFAAGHHQQGVFGVTADGVLAPDVEASLEFTPCEMEPGDVTVFSSYVPHRSRKNLSPTRRTLLYLTYNAQAEGYLRDEYYRHKREHMKSGRLSLIKHFQGIAVKSVTAAEQNDTESCLAPPTVEGKLDELRTMFATFGDTMYDPVVTQLEHALQSAAHAEKTGTTDALVTAALLHDVGHLLLDEHMGNDGFLDEDKEHERAGADFLAARFPPEVSEVVRLHVPAKRYLCQAFPAYWKGLSDSSKRSLEVQGGPFSEAEAAAFIQLPHGEAAAQLRKWDDTAKRAGVATPTLEYYLEGAVKRVLSSHA